MTGRDHQPGAVRPLNGDRITPMRGIDGHIIVSDDLGCSRAVGALADGNRSGERKDRSPAAIAASSSTPSHPRSPGRADDASIALLWRPMGSQRLRPPWRRDRPSRSCAATIPADLLPFDSDQVKTQPQGRPVVTAGLGSSDRVAGSATVTLAHLFPLLSRTAQLGIRRKPRHRRRPAGGPSGNRRHTRRPARLPPLRHRPARRVRSGPTGPRREARRPPDRR